MSGEIVGKRVTRADRKLLTKLKYHSSGFRTICQIHRELYKQIAESDMGKPLRDSLINLIVEAFACGLKMSKRLHEYNPKEKSNLNKFYERNLSTQNDLDKRVWRELNEKG